MENQTRPYSDDCLTFDELTGHYVLTEKYLLDNYGLDLYNGANGRNL